MPPPGRNPNGTDPSAPFSASLYVPSPERTRIASESRAALGSELRRMAGPARELRAKRRPARAATRSTSVIRSPVTWVEYGLTIIAARFTLASMPRRTALIIAVPEAEPAVAAPRLRHDPMARLGVPAHITIHFPFAPPDAVDEEAVAELVAGRSAFPFELASVEHFGDDVTYLAPRPAAPFCELIEASAARWPEYPRYDGAFAEIVPHLTVGLARLELQLALPIACVARAVTLLEEGDDGRWSVRRRFELQPLVA